MGNRLHKLVLHNSRFYVRYSIFIFLKRRSSTGFTLIELMIILFILGILMAIAIPSFSSWLPEYRLKRAVRELYSNMQFAKMKAISAHETYRLTFNYTGNSYMLQRPDASIKKNIDFLDYDPYGNIGYGKGSATKSANSSGGPIPSDFISFQNNRAAFNSRGTGSNGYVYLANSNGTAYAVGIWSAGFVKIKKWNDAKKKWE
jgi:prepilin-type N-terminal cleavage/methylation domain-containing protein